MKTLEIEEKEGDNHALQFDRRAGIEENTPPWHHERDSYSVIALLFAAESSNQSMEAIKPQVVSTIPFSNEFTIRDKITDMLGNTNRLWICSRFINEFFSSIIKLANEQPEMDIRIITIPIGEAKDGYHGAGRKFLELAFQNLQIALKDNVKTTPLLHARCVITDSAVLISSADLSSEQLEKEFNLGMWTMDREAVQSAVLSFEKVWNSI